MTARRMGALRIGPVLVALALMVGVVAGLSAPAEARTASVAKLRVGWGVNGPVYAVAVKGNTLYVGGSFSAAIGRNGTKLARHNLAAFSLSTGRPLRGWVANTDGAVHALVVARGAVWVGGKFESVNGTARERVAKLSTRSGAVRTGFQLDVNNTVRALAVTKTGVYAGGDFTAAGSITSSHLVAARVDTGAVLTRFTARANRTVWALAARPNGRTLYVGGAFTKLDGKRRVALGALNAATGAVRGVVFRQSSGPVLSIDLSGNGRRVAAAVGGRPRAAAGNSIAAWNTATGVRAWRVRLSGDGQAVDIFGNTVYGGFHGGFHANHKLKLIAINLRTGTVRRAFQPRFNDFWGVRAIAVNRRGVAVGGEFTKVDKVKARRVAVFRGRW
ncbi:MAG: PQQ-binding-like beta-propeller repeat protein [Nocardioides sp.]|uniref:hypothetical protein n=1 Tax=Nocardioides sp. TaxID=35761 RepID=UPI0039E3D339